MPLLPPAARGALRPSRLSLVASLGLMALQAGVFAQTPEAAPRAPDPGPLSSAATLPAVEVRAKAAPEDPAGPTPGYRTTRTRALRTDAPLNEIPQSISVITADQIRDQNAQTMQEVLRYTAGVHADVYGLDNRGDWFMLRGGSEGSTLLDGLRRPLTGYYGVVRDDPYAFERVEVLRGPSSVIAGQNGPGGVVNLVSKRPQAEAQREASMQLGSHDHKQLAADLTGPLTADGSVLYRVVALARDSGTQVNYAHIERRYLAPSITWQIDPRAKLWAYAQVQRDRSGNTEGFFPLEGTLYDRPQGRIPIDTFVSEPEWDMYGGRRLRAGYEFEYRLLDGWTLRHKLRHDDVEGGQRSMWADFYSGWLPDGRSLGRFWYATDDRGRITSTDLFVDGKLQTGRIEHTLLAGVDTMRQTTSKIYWSGSATPLDVYTPTYGNWAPPTLLPSNGTLSETGLRQWGLVLQDQMKFDGRWVLVAGLRRDKVHTTSAGSAAQDSFATSRNIGGVWLADGGWSPYVSYSESFEPNAADALGNVFAPKRGRQTEVGLKWQPPGTSLTATAAAYKLRESGRLKTGATPGTLVPMGDVKVEGVELELTARLRAWDVIASYTRTSAHDAEAGARVANVPDQSAALWAVHRFDHLGWHGLKAGLGLRYIGHTWDGTDALRTPSATVADAMVGWEQGPWMVALNVTNLADRTHLAACLDRGDCWYGTKREIVFTAGYRF